MCFEHRRFVQHDDDGLRLHQGRRPFIRQPFGDGAGEGRAHVRSLQVVTRQCDGFHDLSLVRERHREIGREAFDFLRGEEGYKYRWGAQDRGNRRRVIRMA